MRTRTARAPGDPPSRLPGFRASDRLPDVLVTTHRGDRVRFATDLIRDRVVIINFMYTNCDGTCPGTGAALMGLRPRLTEAFGTDARILSVTLDPAWDSVELLAAYAAIYGAGRPDPALVDWLYLTGDPANLDRIRRALGFDDPDPVVDADKTQHASLLAIGNDRTNRWTTQPYDLGREELWRTILRVAGETPEQRFGHLGSPGPGAS